MQKQKIVSGGFVRRIDSLGRLCIPKSVRDSLNFQEYTPIEIYIENGKIILENYKNACSFCGTINAEEFIEFKSHLICGQCKTEFNALSSN